MPLPAVAAAEDRFCAALAPRQQGDSRRAEEELRAAAMSKRVHQR
jgi:hypothetical protein